MRPAILGVDIGGVLIDRVADGSDTSFFSDNFLETPEVPGSFEALRVLGAGVFGSRIHLVSKCGPKIEARTRQWLDHTDFHVRAGVPPEHVHFCRERKHKASICARLGVTHFVDDRLDVLEYLETVGRKYLFQPRPADLARAANSNVSVAPNWNDVLADLARHPPT